MSFYSDEISTTTQTNLGPLSKGIKVWQKFTSKADRLTAISLLFATYRKTINSIATLTIWDSERRKVLRRVDINTRDIVDNSWKLISFDPIFESKGVNYWFCVETNARRNDSVTLWTNNTILGVCWKKWRKLSEAVCFKCHYMDNSAYFLDHLLFRNRENTPLPSIRAQEELQSIISYCVNFRGFYFLRLAHLADAFGMVPGVRKVLSIGCGEAFQEAFLAGRIPDLDVHGTDLLPRWRDFSARNLHFSQKDILEWSEEGDYDFVFSIETLEHIDDYRLAFKNMASKVKPGKYLYISVPFASKEEQQDEALCKREKERWGHVLPGFTFNDLEDLFEENGLRVIHSTNMFRFGIANYLNDLLGKMDVYTIQSGMLDIVHLFLLEITDKRAQNQSEAVGIRFLGQKIGKSMRLSS